TPRTCSLSANASFGMQSVMARSESSSQAEIVTECAHVSSRTRACGNSARLARRRLLQRYPGRNRSMLGRAVDDRVDQRDHRLVLLGFLAAHLGELAHEVAVRGGSVVLGRVDLEHTTD